MGALGMCISNKSPVMLILLVGDHTLKISPCLARGGFAEQYSGDVIRLSITWPDRALPALDQLPMHSLKIHLLPSSLHDLRV